MSKKLNRSSKAWTEDEISSLEYLCRVGTDYERIGDALGRSSDAVAMKASLLRKNGVDLPYKRRRRTVTTTVEEEEDLADDMPGSEESNDQDRIAVLEARVRYLYEELGLSWE